MAALAAACHQALEHGSALRPRSGRGSLVNQALATTSQLATAHTTLTPAW